jgi:hypothetical protein
MSIFFVLSEQLIPTFCRENKKERWHFQPAPFVFNVSAFLGVSPGVLIPGNIPFTP